MKTIAIANEKGGTGKTTLAVHMAVGLARRKRRVLFLDLDLQATATKWLMGLPARPKADFPGVASVLESGKLPDVAVHPSYEPRLSVVPATDALQSAEYAIAHSPAGQVRLRHALRSVARQWDFTIIDCAPNLGVAVVSGLCASDAVFVPVPCNFLGISGLADLDEAMQALRQGYKVATMVAGLVLFNVDVRKALTQATRHLLNEHAGEKLMAAEIRTSTAAERLPELHKTAWDSGVDLRGAEDYSKFLDEALARLGARKGKR